MSVILQRDFRFNLKAIGIPTQKKYWVIRSLILPTTLLTVWKEQPHDSDLTSQPPNRHLAQLTKSSKSPSLLLATIGIGDEGIVAGWIV